MEATQEAGVKNIKRFKCIGSSRGEKNFNGCFTAQSRFGVSVMPSQELKLNFVAYEELFSFSNFLFKTYF